MANISVGPDEQTITKDLPIYLLCSLMLYLISNFLFFFFIKDSSFVLLTIFLSASRFRMFHFQAKLIDLQWFQKMIRIIKSVHLIASFKSSQSSRQRSCLIN